MANRSYLYSLSDEPTSYADRPETVGGLAEWAYDVPFSYRVLVSCGPRLCASLISDGFEDDDPQDKTPLFGIIGEFDAGLARLKKFGDAARLVGSAALRDQLDRTEEFLHGHRNRFVLLETVELDCMETSEADALRERVEREIARCREVGAAIDALPDTAAAAAVELEKAAGPFRGLVFGDDFDNVRDRRTTHPIGLGSWSEVLYFSLWNKAEFEAAN
ncbi:hypothetical protein [Actinosynnema sp. NPDC020468]|uniref:DUF7822 domain-containing protein n=1 Tax=Actinosynnema sp. NPDC020468 TaxID=3154488 RepID=UPI003407E7B2